MPRKPYKRWISLSKMEITAYVQLARQWSRTYDECAALAYLQYQRLIKKAPSTTRKKINEFLVPGQTGWVSRQWEKAAQEVREIEDFNEAAEDFSTALGLIYEEEVETIHFGRLQIEDYPQDVGIWVYLPGCIDFGAESTPPRICTARGWVAFQAGGSGIGTELEKEMFWEEREADMDRQQHRQELDPIKDKSEYDQKFPFKFGMLIRNQRGKYYKYPFTWEQWEANGCQRCIQPTIQKTGFRCL